MPIPTYEACMRPLLQLLSDGQIHSTKDLTHAIESHFSLSDEERERLLPSGQQRYIANRVGWAKTSLKNAGLLENVQRAQIRITDGGRQFLAMHPNGITAADLMAAPSFIQFLQRRRESKEADIETSVTEPIVAEADTTPDEAIENAYEEIREALAEEILEQVLKASPVFFERLVLDLLIAMGYGGSRPERGTHLGQSGDGGIDGIINEDKLGLDIICVQAKRWKDSVGRPTVQAFAGSMEAHRAKKGVMISTSPFTREARDFIERIERKIVLIDGRQLAQLMIEHSVGVTPAKTYTIKKVDLDYFLEEA